MSESAATVDVGHGAGEQPTAGSILRNAREAAGLHIEALAVALKVPVGKLEALEADRHDLLPDTVFMRALASSICRTLKLDSALVLSLLPQSQSPRLSPTHSDINTPVKSGAGKTFVSGGGSRHSRGMMFGVLALLLGAAAVFYWPTDFRPWHSVGEAKQEVTTGSTVDAEVALPNRTGDSSTVEQAPQAIEPVAVASGAGAVVASVSPAPAAPPASAVVPAASEAAATALLLLRAKGESWVQVRDASGRVVFEKKLAAGDSAPVTGALPLSVVVGRADLTDVFVRGKPIELNTVSRENVARFEVK
jgi:cytoskeleton protein RodZ